MISTLFSFAPDFHLILIELSYTCVYTTSNPFWNKTEEKWTHSWISMLKKNDQTDSCQIRLCLPRWGGIRLRVQWVARAVRLSSATPLWLQDTQPEGYRCPSTRKGQCQGQGPMRCHQDCPLLPRPWQPISHHLGLGVFWTEMIFPWSDFLLLTPKENVWACWMNVVCVAGSAMGKREL